MKQTILVTGGTGFIGSHTTVELQQAGYNVVIVDDLSNSKIEVLDGIEKITGIRPAFEQVDLRDKAATEAVFQKYPDIEGIIHFAASKAVGESVQKPLLYYRNNLVFAHQSPGTYAKVSGKGYHLLFFLYRLWSAEAREFACNRRGSSSEGYFTLWQYQGGE